MPRVPVPVPLMQGLWDGRLAEAIPLADLPETQVRNRVLLAIHATQCKEADTLFILAELPIYHSFILFSCVFFSNY